MKRAGAGERYIVGIDLGGTNLRGALADDSGEILGELREPTAQGSAEVMIGQVAALVERLAEGHAVAAVGVSAAVAVDPETGAVDSTANVPGLAGVRLAAELERAIGHPVVVANDADLAALAEGRSGVAVGVRDYVVIAIGTGIGMGIVANGELRRGWRGMAGEIGLVPMPDGSNYEAAAAGPALRARIAEGVAWSAGTRLSAEASLSDLIEAAELADPVAARILAEQVRLVAWGIATAAFIVDPELVILSGGIGAVPGLLDPVRAAVGALMSLPPRIETSALGDRGPLLGALDAAASLGRSASLEHGRTARPVIDRAGSR